jgi:hypothetical protein
MDKSPETPTAWADGSMTFPVDDMEIAFQTNWVYGFLSAFNYYGTSEGDIANGIDSNGLFAWIENYCAAHPLDTIAAATIALITDLSKRQ